MAGPETANNAYANAAFLPLLTLGTPSSAALAILFGAFVIHGIAPGTTMFSQNSEVAWAVISSMLVGNLILLAFGLPLLRVWFLALKVPDPVMGGIILSISAIGMYSVNNNAGDILLMLAFAVLGCILKLGHFPLAPAILAFILADKIEASLSQSLIIANGNAMIFITRPISGVLFGAIALYLCYIVFKSISAGMQRLGKGRATT